ncbi:hypothetical protein CIPAW_03G094500 [Carya illinoinensis]|uniref:Uncharacterized protein n=1 Tax=Carya illinoinensis TaxID=32201 RepID=A0A8T1R0Q4_CARIL|nr:hypothetical protein CIPAW_03G094500 [Carya illinoinensis]
MCTQPLHLLTIIFGFLSSIPLFASRKRLGLIPCSHPPSLKSQVSVMLLKNMVHRVIRKILMHCRIEIKLSFPSSPNSYYQAQRLWPR